eukprot:CAMPEP_0115135314 /NCGR_PEP_ID=MMETSP0227-20121206/55652_1 /TAXON_ID=89957 /ORGANISM="Polarella glacialis, Strain CCMP 1383" /LENGTH=35 /DNA_ID= /DNA_START= /DNA_END= /DNA_ORIENTATION=
MKSVATAATTAISKARGLPRFGRTMLERMRATQQH